MLSLQTSQYTLEIHPDLADCLICYHIPGMQLPLKLAPPCFEVEGVSIPMIPACVEASCTHSILPNGCEQYHYMAPIQHHPEFSLEIVLRSAPHNPFVRFQYRLHTNSPVRLTKSSGRDNLEYARISLQEYPHAREIQLSVFNELTHAYQPVEFAISPAEFEIGVERPGPLIAASNADCACLLAYEHGSTVPNTYLNFKCANSPSQGRTACLQAVKGNYTHNQEIDAAHPFETIWMQLGATRGSLEDLAQVYRSFLLEYFSLHFASRQPKIFYNTWNYQERNRHWNGRPYLESMNEERILAEIEVAHRLGIEVFVLDTGWYSKTGDWQVELDRFPGGLKNIQAKLAEYGMRLGVWIAPAMAALSSRLHRELRECAVTRNGIEPDPWPVWETEESRWFCLVSRFADALADELIRLNHELGVTYFKWDAVTQEGGCDSPHHWHGGVENSPQERAECWEFELVRSLTHIAERISEACPQAIVDLDLTESGRSLGLAFLSAGKYFLINNGPYFGSYDVPAPGTNENLFFYPGSARAAICRTSLGYDRWIPSILFLTHFLPDDPPPGPAHWSRPHGSADSLEVNLASLMLGGNGIWGDLLSIPESGIVRAAGLLEKYKRLRTAITRAYPVRQGPIGGSPEIHEKLTRGQGVVVIFSTFRGTYTYLTHNPVGSVLWCSEGVQVAGVSNEQAMIQAVFDRPGAKIIFFE
jgi:alpha-galactosidase